MQPKNCKLYTVVILLFCVSDVTVFSDPGLFYLGGGCSNDEVTNSSNFEKKLITTFGEITTNISNGNHFVTAEEPGDTNTPPVYAMLQCRDYMSAADCLACFNNASAQIRKSCTSRIGGREIYDGCFLRYETTSDFYGKNTAAGDESYKKCGDRTTSSPSATAFTGTVKKLAEDLRLATPQTKDFYAASKREVAGATKAAVYAVAQCVHTISKGDCQACLDVAFGNITECPPIGDARFVDSGCFMRYSDAPFFADNQTTDIGSIIDPPGPDPNLKKALIGGLVGGGALVILLLVAFFAWRKRSRNRGWEPVRRGDIFVPPELQGPTKYSYGDLKAATRNFSLENKLGSGGSAAVYKGTLKNGKVVAVKRLFQRPSERLLADFESEVILIGNVNHRNLVRLLGYCSEGPELLLVYECMANGSLDSFLFGEKRGSLNWRKRYDVILGSAQGLAYLHEQYQVRIIHRDIKSNNVLLDDHFQPKIADFGLAKLLPDNRSHLSTGLAGTTGYTAPEYALRGQLSEKVDTYSYGVVVLEIISGIRSTDLLLDDPVAEYLLKRAWNLYENDMHLELVDGSLDPNEYEAEEVKKIIELALICTQSLPVHRPAMTKVVALLKNMGSLENRRPTRPHFIDREQRVLPDNSTSTVSPASNATVSITERSGRLHVVQQNSKVQNL